MRRRTFILIILVLILAAAAVAIFLIFGGGLDVAGLISGGEDTVPGVAETPSTDDGLVAGAQVPTPTPLALMAPVVVSKVDIPTGVRLTEDLLGTELRPDTNIAVQAGYVFADVDEVVGRIARVPIARGQSVLSSMLALSPLDIASLGSDLSLYVDQGNVALALPINRFSGAAYALRPGDFVDVLMSLTMVKIDEDFQTAKPNLDVRVDPVSLQEGGAFLFSPLAEGRLELIPGINVVASIGPGGADEWDYAGGELLQIPRRVTQLTVQQARVLWVGTWQDPREIAAEQAPAAAEPSPEEGPAPTPAPTSATFGQRESSPDVVILSMPPQDALALKWALDRGLDVDFALRSQGDNSVFVTTSVSLPQMVEQGGLTVPDRGEFDVHPRADDVDPPSIPRTPPQ